MCIYIWCRHFEICIEYIKPVIYTHICALSNQSASTLTSTSSTATAIWWLYSTKHKYDVSQHDAIRHFDAVATVDVCVCVCEQHKEQNFNLPNPNQNNKRNHLGKEF